MASLTSSTYFLTTILLLFPMVFPQSQSQLEKSFIFNGFNGNESSLTLDMVSIIKPSGSLRLTNKTLKTIGRAFYAKPIKLFNKTNSSNTYFSFSTSFVFSIVPPSSSPGGYGLAFLISPSTHIDFAQADHYLGIFNSTNDGDPSNRIFAVEFDTVNGFNDESDTQGNHVGININSMNSNATEPASYYRDANNKEEMDLESGKPIQAWVEYDGFDQVINVTISPIWKAKPSKPLISFTGLNLSSVLNDTVYFGFSASTGKKASSHYVLGWSFSLSGEAPPLNLSKLSMPPMDKSSSKYKPSIIALIASLSGVALVLLTLLVFLVVFRRSFTERLEEWELECPHRFRYRDLYTASKGFKESEIIGVGGFGVVYKAIMPDSGNQVAVKKINRGSIQGLREFVAEIESLGRLRHKNLVNLRGWCKHKNDLFLVYDYVPNGSLHSLLFRPQNGMVLTWEQRFNIVKGIASGLLYLHEEWEQLVIHRDIKSSNVLVDLEMNAHLGDFGLARLYDHGTSSHTTNIVGTIGYIAPELARTGKASACSDVYGYGILLLEVVSGRRPISSDNFVLVDWILECHLMGKILYVVDPRMGLNYVVEEVEMILYLGLICSHQRQDFRPSMRQVLRYLNGDDKLPMVDDWQSTDSRSEMDFNLTEVIFSDNNVTSKSYHSSSNGGISLGSIYGGR